MAGCFEDPATALIALDEDRTLDRLTLALVSIDLEPQADDSLVVYPIKQICSTPRKHLIQPMVYIFSLRSSQFREYCRNHGAHHLPKSLNVAQATGASAAIHYPSVSPASIPS